MPARSAPALVVLGALLVLSVGIGSALFATQSGRLRVATAPPPTVTVAPDTPQIVSLVDPEEPTPAPTRPLAIPTPAVVPTESPLLARPPSVPTMVPPTATTVALTFTPRPTPRPERTGGPVVVPNNHKGVRWVTLQAGHYQNRSLPEELEHLTTHTGAFAAGVSEVDINVAVAELTAQRLYERGYSVQLLDATVPPGYTTDLFLALHADGNADNSIRGFKAVAPWGSVPASDIFVGFLYEEYGKATGLPSDAKTSAAMANYYAFNPVKYRHAINAQVPAALLEMGFVTNAQDREVMTQRADRLAWGIANAVDRYFRSGAAGPTPSPYPTFTPSKTPSPTRTSTFTPTLSPTPILSIAGTPGVIPPVRQLMLTKTAQSQARPPDATSTPLEGVLTKDGHWLPPLAPNGRKLPPPGSDAPPVLLGEADDDPGPDAQINIPAWQPHVWKQYYIPRLGRSTWTIGPVFERTPTATPTIVAP